MDLAFQGFQHSYFPNLIPIIDRRALNGLELLNSTNYDFTAKQVKDIGSLYDTLLREIWQLTVKNEGAKSIREIDEILFARVMLDKK